MSDKKTVLVIDDNYMLLNSVNAILSQRYKVYCAPSGPSSIEIVDVKTPDLVLLDYEMPDFDGAETYEILKDFPGMRDVPIVFLTGISDVANVKKLLALNPAGYLLKPVTQEQLLEITEKLIGV